MASRKELGDKDSKQEHKSTTAKLQNAFSEGASVAGHFLKQTGSILKHTALLAYTRSPINFSFVTGYRWPHISRLMGDPAGQFWVAQRDRGRGVGLVGMKASQLALNDPRGMSYFWMAYKPVLVVTAPWDIKQVIFNENKTKRGIIFEIFDSVYGHDNLLCVQSSDEQRRRRSIVIQFLFGKKGLKELAPEVEQIIDEFIAEKMRAGEVIEARHFFVNLTLNVFSQSAVGTRAIPDESVSKMESVFGEALHSSLDPWNYAKITMSAIVDYINLKLKFDSIERPKADLQRILNQLILEPSEEKMRQSGKLLAQLSGLEQKGGSPDFDTDLMRGDLAMLLFAGHDTTSTLLQFAFVLLADHPLRMEKLYQEINKYRPENNKWSNEALDNVEYLKWVLEETLRLYPVVGFSLRTVTESFSIAKIPPCTSELEYKKALKNRSQLSKSEDVQLYPGDQLLFAPVVTQRALFPEADKFIPERCDPENPLYVDKSLKWIPFSFGKRDCPGRNFALMEAARILISILDKMKAQNLRLEVNQHHPLDLYNHGTLQFKKSLQIRLVPIEPEDKPEYVRRCQPGH